MSRAGAIRAFGAALLAAGLAAAAALSTVAASTAPAAPEVGPSGTLLTALQRNLGLSAAQADARLGREAAAPGTARAAEQLLGASFAGTWFEPGSALLVVATTDAASVAGIRALGAQPRLVARDAVSLDAQQAALDARAAGVPESVTGWYVDLPTNSVVVTATDPAAAQTFAAGTGTVRIEQVSQSPRPLADLVGGEAINDENEGRCSIGFNATSGSTRYVITAGHCTSLGGTWFGHDGSAIGPATASSFPGNDYGLIRVDSSSWTQTPRVAGDGSVTGSSEAVVGSSVCRSGSTTGYRCGTIQARNQTVNYGGGDLVSGLTRTSVCAEAGDSGGSYVTGSQAQGVLSGGSGSCLLGGETFFQPVNEILSAYRVNLVTG